MSVFLALLGFLFLLPSFIWKMISLGQNSYEMNDLVETAQTISREYNSSPEKLDQSIDDITTRYVQIMFIQQGLHDDIITRILDVFAKYLPLVSFSKSRGTWMTSWYFITKLLYIANCVFVLLAMSYFISYNDPSSDSIMRTLLDTFPLRSSKTISRTFPTITYCYIDDHKNIASNKEMALQCTVPGNVILQKLYLSFYLWIIVLLALTIVSTFQWVFLFLFRSRNVSFIKSCLHGYVEKLEDDKIAEFTRHFLKSDGLFIVKMMATHMNHAFITKFMKSLYHSFESLKSRSQTDQ